MPEKIKIRSDIKLDWYKIVDRVVSEGIDYGWSRAHKHTLRPDAATIKEEIYRAVMTEIAEIVVDDDDNKS